MEDDQDLTKRLLWLNEHFERLTALVPAENLQARPELKEEDEEEFAESSAPKHPKMSVVRTIVKSKTKGDQEGSKPELKMVKREALVPRRNKKKKKRKGIDREQIVRMIKKQKGGGDDSGVDSDGSIDLGKKETQGTVLGSKEGGETHVSKEGKNRQLASAGDTSVNQGSKPGPSKTENAGKKKGSETAQIGNKKEKGKAVSQAEGETAEKTTKRTKELASKNQVGKGGKQNDKGKQLTKKSHSSQGEEVSKEQPDVESSSDDSSEKSDVDTPQIESPRTNSKVKVDAAKEALQRRTLAEDLFEDAESSSDDSSDEEVILGKGKNGMAGKKELTKAADSSQGDNDLDDTLEDIEDMPSASEDDSSSEDEEIAGEKVEIRGRGTHDGNDDEEMSFTWSGSDNDETPEGWTEKKKEIKMTPGGSRDPDLREKMRARREELKTERMGKDGRKKESLKKLKDEIKQMRREKKKATTEARRDLKQYLKVKKKEDDEGESSVQFSKLKFESDSFAKKPAKKTKNMVERQTGKNFKVLIDKAERKKEKYEKLKETDPDKAVDWLSKEKWRKAVLQAEGAKIKDDPELLKKSLKRTEKRKERSRTKMVAIKEKEERDKRARQEKRSKNIKERRQKKVAAKVKRLQRKGKLLLEDRDKM